MKMIIVFVIFIVMEILAAGTLGAEKYGLYFRQDKEFRVHRISTEGEIKWITAIMSFVTVGFVWIFAERLQVSIKSETVVSVFLAIAGIAMLYLWWTAIEIMEYNDLDSVMDFLELLSPVIGGIMLLVLGAVLQCFIELGSNLPSIVVTLLAIAWCYYEVLYRASVVGGNLRIRKLQRV